MAAIIHQYLQSPFRSDQSSTWKKNLLRFANAAAAIVASRQGASRAMPTLDQVEAFLSQAES
jgi:sugar/nucleoside kinase (ribokinase family)